MAGLSNHCAGEWYYCTKRQRNVFDFEQAGTQLASKIVKLRGFKSGPGFVTMASK